MSNVVFKEKSPSSSKILFCVSEGAVKLNSSGVGVGEKTSEDGVGVGVGVGSSGVGVGVGVGVALIIGQW